MNPRILLMLLCIFFISPQLYAQVNCTTPRTCISNPGLNPPTGVPLYANGTPITNTMIPDWSVLSGTPVIGPGAASTNGFELVSDVTNGEGMVTCYTFLKDRTYKVCFRAYNTTTESGGSLILEAHDGATKSKFIRNDTFYRAGPSLSDCWVTFTANDNFNQLRIYTSYTPSVSNPYAITMDDIGIIEVPDVTASPAMIDGCGTTTLNANSGYPLTISWSRIGVTVPSGTPVSASPCTTTTYIASYSTGCTLYGCNGSNNIPVTVTVQPGINATASPATILTCGSSTLTASSTNPMTVTWSPATGLSATQGNVVTASPCTTTTYTATFACPNCPPYTKKVTVYVQPNGQISDNSATACYGQIELQYTPATACGGFSYKWFGPKNPGIILSTQSKLLMPTSTPGDMGTYSVIVTTANGCADTFYESVIMNCCNIAADFEIVGCNPVRFINKTTANGSTAFNGTWHWDFGDGAPPAIPNNGSTLKNPPHLFTDRMGLHTVCMTAVVFDSLGLSTCCDKICKEVEVCDWGTCNPMSAFDFVVADPVARQIQLRDQSAGGGYPCGWTWTVDGAVVASTQNPVISLGPALPSSAPNTYTVCLDVQYCMPNGYNCTTQWCEDIVVPFP